MQYRALGRTGIRVGVIGLGAEHLEDAPAETVVSVVHEALDHGVNYIDLFMGSPGVRDNFGRALAGRREEVLIAGHLGATWDGQYVKSRDPKICEDFVHDLLRRVGLETLGVLMLHFVDEPEDCDRVMAPGGLLEVALRLKREGKARCLGVSSHAVPATLRLIGTGCIDVVMFPVNPIFDRLPGVVDLMAHWKEDPYAALLAGGRPVFERDELYQACARAGVGIIAMKAYAGGWLFKPQNPAGAALRPAQCLSYALTRPAVCAAVPGCRSVDEMRAALSYLSATEADKDFSSIGAAPIMRLGAPCLYCNHCLPCPAGIDVAAVTRLLDAAGETPDEQMRADYAALAVKASACLDCGACRERCPFGVDAPANLRRAAEVFRV